MIKKSLYIFLSFLLFCLIVLVYARFFGTVGLRTNEIYYERNFVAEGYDGLKIVHFSDLHYKKVITEKRVNELVTEINRIKPDIVLFTGDLLDNDYKTHNDDIQFLIKKLTAIEAKYGKFAIVGDHDYLKTETIRNIYIQSNFSLLENGYSIIHNENNEKIFIGGVSSSLYEEADIDQVMSYFQTNENIDFKIIMVHEGDYIKEILRKYGNINLIVAGHSINGSINIPLIKYFMLPNGAKRYYEAYYRRNGTDIYVSNGIGVNTVNFRLFNRPSINFYRVYKET